MRGKIEIYFALSSCVSPLHVQHNNVAEDVQRSRSVLHAARLYAPFLTNNPPPPAFPLYTFSLPLRAMAPGQVHLQGA